MNDPIAVFQCLNGTQKALYLNVHGRLFQGTIKGGELKNTQSLTLPVLRLWRDSILDRSMWVVKSPQSPYHVWHICMCDECTILDQIWETVAGGRVWTHSQGDWDSHLRQAPNDRVFTFATVCETDRRFSNE